jgi:hypothetical protein
MTCLESDPTGSHGALLVEDSHDDAALTAYELRRIGFDLTWDRMDIEVLTDYGRVDCHHGPRSLKR